MRLYAGMSAAFIEDTVRNQIARKLSDAFFQYYSYPAAKSEVASWGNSLRAMAQVVEYAKLNDHGVIVEYELPSSSRRLDFMICGRDASHRDEAIIVELKQWSECEAADADGLVSTWVGGKNREVAHPSVQVGQYQQYLADTHSAFYEGDHPILLGACSYLHNYEIRANDVLVAPKFTDTLARYPIFGADGVDGLKDYLRGRVPTGRGELVLARIEQSKYRPSRKLMDYVAETIAGRGPWVLLDEQLVVFEKIRAAVASAVAQGKRHAVIIRGGPGTGKSVLAINLLARFLGEGRTAHYATGSRAFTKTLWKLVGSRARPVLKYFNNYRNASSGEIDALICDEAHRIRETSNDRFTPKAKQSTEPQIRELLRAAKVAIFFIDDRQGVRPKEIGSSDYIKQHAADLNYGVSEFELEIQFRCSGSAGFVNWISNTLQIERTANQLWTGAEAFDFRILPTPVSLEAAIRRSSWSGVRTLESAGAHWKRSNNSAASTLSAIAKFFGEWNCSQSRSEANR